MAVRRLALAFTLLVAAPALAQKRPPMEFTRQGFLVLNFAAGEGADVKLGRRAGDRVRDRVGDLLDGREVDVIDARKARERLEHDGYTADLGFEPSVFHQVSRIVRADEYVMGTVTRRGGVYQVNAELRLVRSAGTKQPLEPVIGADLDVVGDGVARALVATRAQLVHERRCANALRAGRGAEALQAARAGITAVARGAYVRACQVGALIATKAPAVEVLAAAEALLAIDPTSREGLDGAGRALNVLGRRDAAAGMWLRLAATDTSNVELTLRAAGGLLDGDNAARALPLLAGAVAASPSDLSLRRIYWQAAFQAKAWPLAAELGDTLLARDGEWMTTPVYRLRHALSYRAAGRPQRALALAAASVGEFPSDPGLYVLYTELVQQERDSVIARGVAAFPKSAEMHALAAAELRGRGKNEEALAAMRQAVALDSTLPQGVLVIAQAEFEVGRPDSALASLGRALRGGQDSAAVAQFALAKGNVLLRAAGSTQSREDYDRALRFFALADSTRPSPQSKFLLGTAAIALARIELTDAPTLTDGALSCTAARRGAEMLGAARSGLDAGAAVAPDVARQYLDYAAQLAPFAEKQITAYCEGAGRAAGRDSSGQRGSV